MTLRWAILGTGGAADTALAPAIASDRRNELVAVLSRDAARGAEFARRHGASSVYTSYEALLANKSIDVVAVATPNALHADQVVAAARRGKHVLCDKPLATSMTDGVRAVKECERVGVQLGVNFQYRHHPAFVQMHQWIVDGEVGQVQLVEFVKSAPYRPGWRDDVRLAGRGVLTNVAVHAYDLLGFLLDDQVVEVAAMWDINSQMRLEGLVAAQLRFTRGVVAGAACSQLGTRDVADIHVYGTSGEIVGFRLAPHWPEAHLDLVTSAGTTSTNHANSETHKLAVAAYTDAVLEGRIPNPSGLDGLRSIELVEAIADAARNGQVVRLPRNAAKQ
jgi:1,5-anhydro-D-fructose reductase (1,5-anhydro-D-mannitol-forming)